MTNAFSLLTLNCFGLVLPNTRRRLLALAQQLEQNSYQIVCLQEIQLHRYRNLLVEACTSYPHARSEPYVHCPKGGLLTLSRFPITDSIFEPYVDRGLWYTPMLLDRLFFKGMLITRLTWNNIPMVVINTHLLANFAGDWERRGMYARVEEKQLQQLAETVRAQPADSTVIVVGDFNIPRGSDLYHNFLAHAGLTDLLAGDARATLRIPFGASSRFALPIDYVLVRLPEKNSVEVDCDLCFTNKYEISDRHSGYLSDHYGIELHIAATYIVHIFPHKIVKTPHHTIPENKDSNSMQYKYAKEQLNYSDYSSGRVFYSLPGHPAFPVRLASEIFQRCIAHRETIHQVSSPCTLYDPCCGAAYHLSVLGYLHGEHIQKIIGSDIDERAVALAERNLALLSTDGLDQRVHEITHLLEKYGKESHKQALSSASIFKARLTALTENHQLTTQVFQASATDRLELSQHIQPRSVDIVFSDVPYGQHSQWWDDDMSNALGSMLDALLDVVSPSSIIAVASDKGQKAFHERYQRLEQFQVGKRRVTILKPIHY